ncbi:MAG: MFS transporter [Actinomycetales bacterium]
MARRDGTGWATSALSLGTALNPLNSSMIAVALVVLRGDFHLDVATVTWVITAFYLASAAAQPLMGRLADRFGPRRLFGFGMILVAISCALAPFSPNFALVCAARVLMAVGTATAFPSSVVMVAALSKKAGVSSTRPLGRIQMANTAGAAIGPVIGGLLVSLVGWQALFYINVPLAVAAYLAVRRFAPADAPRERAGLRALLRESDIPGIAAFIGALTLLMMALLDALPGYRWLLLAAGVLAAVLFAWRELRFAVPFLDLRLLGRNRPLLLMYACFAVFNAVYYFAFFGLPQLLEQAAGYGAGTVGALMLPLAAMSVFLTPLAARSIDRWGVRRVMIAGVSGLGVASAALLLLAGSTAAPLVAALTALLGIPYSVVSISSNQGVYASARPQDRGVAAGIYQTCRYLGAISATVMIGLFYGGGVTLANWGKMAVVMVALSAVALILTLRWRAAPSATASAR